MKIEKISILLVFASLLNIGVFAQEETHFSQFTDAQTLFNPATVGIFHGSLRFNGHYRTQWDISGNPYVTMGGSLDLPILSEITGNDFLALGVFAIQDESGLSKTTNTNGGVNLNFGKSFDPEESNFWSLGVKVTYNQKQLNPSDPNLHWGSQWDVKDGTGWTGTSGMTAEQISKTYVGFGAGFNHFYSNHSNIRAMWGVAMNNINRPKVNYLNEEYRLNSSLYYHGEVEIHSHANGIALIPRFAGLFQGPQRYFIVGTSVDFLLKEAGKMTGIVKEASIEFGAFYRWSDAMVFEVQANWAGIGLGFSYDLPVSKIGRPTNYVGAMEVLLHYKLGYKTGIQSKHDNHRFDSIH